MSSLTLNQVITRLETIGRSHKQIKECRTGDTLVFLKGGDLEYPACLIELLPGVISRTEKKSGLEFSIKLCDLINLAEDSKENEIEVQSDLLSIAEDLISMYCDPQYQDTWTVVAEVPFEFQYEQLKDYVSALSMTVTIWKRFDANRCQVPINS